jgi:hypothetical protein
MAAVVGFAPSASVDNERAKISSRRGKLIEMQRLAEDFALFLREFEQ